MRGENTSMHQKGLFQPCMLINLKTENKIEIKCLCIKTNHRICLNSPTQNSCHVEKIKKNLNKQIT